MNVAFVLYEGLKLWDASANEYIHFVSNWVHWKHWTWTMSSQINKSFLLLVLIFFRSISGSSKMSFSNNVQLFRIVNIICRICLKSSVLPGHRSLLVQWHWRQTAQPCPECTQWISPERGEQQEPGGSSGQSLVCPLVAAWDDRRLAGSTHS